MPFKKGRKTIKQYKLCLECDPPKYFDLNNFDLHEDEVHRNITWNCPNKSLGCKSGTMTSRRRINEHSTPGKAHSCRYPKPTPTTQGVPTTNSNGRKRRRLAKDHVEVQPSSPLSQPLSPPLFSPPPLSAVVDDVGVGVDEDNDDEHEIFENEIDLQLDLQEHYHHENDHGEMQVMINPNNNQLNPSLKYLNELLDIKTDMVKQLTQEKEQQQQELVLLEKNLEEEKEMHNHLKHQIESQLSEFNEKRLQVEEFQLNMAKKDEEIGALLSKIDEESASKVAAQNSLHELESQLLELQEELEAEKAARNKAETVKSDLGEELEALRNKLLDSLDTTATQHELRAKREQELVALKKSLEEETVSHEQGVTDLRHRHVQQVQELMEQLDVLKKTRVNLEKVKGTLESQNVYLANKLKSLLGAKTENERKRKVQENQIQELQLKLAESDRVRGELAEKLVKITTELESAFIQMEQANSKASQAEENSAAMESQMTEIQGSLEEETRQKLALTFKFRQLETEKEQDKEKIVKLENDMELLKSQNEELMGNWEEQEEVRQKLENDFEKLFIEASGERNKIEEFVKIQENLEKLLLQEKIISDNISQEKDQAERQVLALNTKLKKKDDQIQELERMKRQLEMDLDQLSTSKGTADKNVHDHVEIMRISIT